jgi:PAS domain S-box-containing protein
MDLLTSLLGREGYLPHGYCLSWSPGLLWSMVGADLAIAAAYFSIPLAIVSFVRQRSEPSIKFVAMLFCAFIFACGLTHLTEVWTIWQPVYDLQALTKIVTAAVSIATAVTLWLLIPKALRIPSVHQLQSVIEKLESEVRQRRSAEEDLAEIQQSLAVTLASIGAGFMATDRDGRVTRMNEVAERVFGWSESQARGRDFRDVFKREDLAPRHAAMNPVDVMVEDGVTVADRQRVVAIAQDGTHTPLEVRAALTYSRVGEIRGLATVFQDLSQVTRAEGERQRAEERFRLVVEAAPSAILMVDRRGTITLANAVADELFGYPREELVGRSIDTLVPDRARSGHGHQVQQFFDRPSARAMASRPELFARRKDGTEVAVEIGLKPIQTVDGLFTLASIIDVTERKRHETELRRSNAELEQFAYVASHDLQEPLRMVVSYSELLAQRYQGQLDARADKYIFYAVDGARRMQRLVADLLAYSRVGSQGKPLQPVASEAVLQRVLTVLRAQILKAGATVQAQPLPLVLADEGQLGQLFQNLIGNAIKFRGEAPPQILVDARRERDRWVFSVKDNGIGIDPQYAERIFQMFQRLHERGKYEGSGIGLAIVKRIVERHGGQIWVESARGAGTTFFFTLPAA